MAIIECNKCGKEIPDQAVSCPYCGKVVIVSNDNQEDENRTNNQNNISASKKKNNGTGNYENDNIKKTKTAMIKNILKS